VLSESANCASLWNRIVRRNNGLDEGEPAWLIERSANSRA
jgi:hypothetical protein